MAERAPNEEENGLRQETGLREHICHLNLAGGCTRAPLRKPQIMHSQVKSSPGRGNGLHRGPEVRKTDVQAVPLPSCLPRNRRQLGTAKAQCWQEMGCIGAPDHRKWAWGSSDLLLPPLNDLGSCKQAALPLQASVSFSVKWPHCHLPRRVIMKIPLSASQALSTEPGAQVHSVPILCSSCSSAPEGVLGRDQVDSSN